MKINKIHLLGLLALFALMPSIHSQVTHTVNTQRFPDPKARLGFVDITYDMYSKAQGNDKLIAQKILQQNQIDAWLQDSSTHLIKKMYGTDSPQSVKTFNQLQNEYQQQQASGPQQ